MLCYNKKDISEKKPLVMKNSGYAWKIEPFNKKTEAKSVQQDKTAIKAGDYLKLFHREKEGFLNVRYKDYQHLYNDDKGTLSVPDMFFDRFLPETEPED